MDEDKVPVNGKAKEAKEKKEIKEEKSAESPKENKVNKEANEYDELKERFLRLAAEFDNYKKRTINEVSTAKELGKAEFLKSMLNVVDEFDLMLIAASRSEDKALAKGIELLYANFMEAMKKSGLKEIEANGTFDPYKHEIALVKEGNEDSKIVEVIQKGYMLNDRMLRPTSVIVSKLSQKEDKPNKGDKNE